MRLPQLGSTFTDDQLRAPGRRRTLRGERKWVSVSDEPCGAGSTVDFESRAVHSPALLQVCVSSAGKLEDVHRLLRDYFDVHRELSAWLLPVLVLLLYPTRWVKKARPLAGRCEQLGGDTCCAAGTGLQDQTGGGGRSAVSPWLRPGQAPSHKLLENLILTIAAIVMQLSMDLSIQSHFKIRMSLKFSGWAVVDDGASSPGVELEESQTPQNRGVYTMFHGTSTASARLILAGGFRQSSAGMLGKGVYVSRDKKKAAHYPLNSPVTDRVVLKVRVRVGRVKRIDQDNHPMQYTWQTNGYDTAWVPPRCGLRAVRSGLEEDCVFDPKRVQVVGIAKAPSTAVQQELQEVLSKRSRQAGQGGDGVAHVCSLCKRATQQGAPHIKQRCWECGKNICIFMSKHVCRAKVGEDDVD
uniref:PARP catalytic domain-containing protein n=5 Tax=Gasterosteus aculeatus TaxID=69293 RepID=A0AAQ4NRA8_GASAC